MFRRNLIPIWAAITVVANMYLMGQDCAAQSDPCDPDPCQDIPNSVAYTCTPIGGSCTPANDFTCTCDTGYNWEDATNSCEEPQPSCIDNDEDGYYAIDPV